MKIPCFVSTLFAGRNFFYFTSNKAEFRSKLFWIQNEMNRIRLPTGTVPTINLHLRIKIEPVLAGADATVYVWLLCTNSIYLAQKPDIHHCICSHRDRLSNYVESQFFFGTLWTLGLLLGEGSLCVCAPLGMVQCG